MDIQDNERLQEFFLVVGDKLSVVKKIWWYALLLAVIAAVPVYLSAKQGFTQLFLAGYTGPKIIYADVAKQPLTVTDKQIFSQPGQTYSGYIIVKNINLEWGVASQEYHVDFKTLGGTVVNTVDRSTYILPSSQQLIVLPRFSSNAAPGEIDVTLGESHFIHEPNVSVNFPIQRTTLANNSSGLIVTAAVVNQTPFTVSEIDLPVAIYNTQNQIVAVNYTEVNQVQSNETRTFQYTWPSSIPGAVRAEIDPEIDIFDPSVFAAPQAVSPGSGSSSR